MANQKVWMVTGSSRGLGRALAEEILAQGDKLVATARNPEDLAPLAEKYGDAVCAVSVDVREPKQVEAAVQLAVKAFGRLDVLVNNAGYGFIGAFEEMTEEQFKGQIDTNFWGVVNATRAVLPVMRAQGSGHIFQITSIGGRAANPGLSGYHAAKFAVEGLSEALAGEVRPSGIKVCIVEPGGFRTDWAGSSMGFAKPMEAYKASVGGFREFLRAGYRAPGDPKKAAQAILQLAELPELPLRQPLGTDAAILLKYGYEQSLAQLAQTSALARSTDAEDADKSATEGILLKLQEALS
jgi:NAD(P)-dependent dehydrogenase (short-subunit alcohol dehydrogenase family)